MKRYRRRVAVAVASLAVACGGLAAPSALADPDFGPGASKKGPHDPGARCHPPGQTTDRPECK